MNNDRNLLTNCNYEEFSRKVGERLAAARCNRQMTPDRWKELEQGKIISSEQFAIYCKKKYLSECTVAKINQCSRMTVINHEKGKHLSLLSINKYCDIYHISAGKILCNIDSDCKRFWRTDEDEIRKGLAKNGTKEKLLECAPVNSTTSQRWFSNDNDRIQKIPLKRYYSFVELLDISLEDILFPRKV